MMILNVICYDMQIMFYELRRRSLSRTLREMHANSFVLTHIIIDIHDITIILMIL